VAGNESRMKFASLPRLQLEGDFALQCEFLLGGRNPLLSPRVTDHVFRLELGGDSGPTLAVMVNYQGTVWLGQGAPVRTPSFRPFTDTQFRLTRRGDAYTVSINGQEADAATIRGLGTITKARIGLTGGMPTGNFRDGKVFARLYSIKITKLE
jgi:hypothetical protein